MALDRLLLLLLIAVALLAGVWIGRQGDAAEPVGADSFRGWLWQRRGLDLVVQACLVFVGALGTAALLPRDGEEDD